LSRKLLLTCWNFSPAQNGFYRTFFCTGTLDDVDDAQQKVDSQLKRLKERREKVRCSSPLCTHVYRRYKVQLAYLFYIPNFAITLEEKEKGCHGSSTCV